MARTPPASRAVPRQPPATRSAEYTVLTHSLTWSGTGLPACQARAARLRRDGRLGGLPHSAPRNSFPGGRGPGRGPRSPERPAPSFCLRRIFAAGRYFICLWWRALRHEALSLRSRPGPQPRCGPRLPGSSQPGVPRRTSETMRQGGALLPQNGAGDIRKRPPGGRSPLRAAQSPTR